MSEWLWAVRLTQDQQTDEIDPEYDPESPPIAVSEDGDANDPSGTVIKFADLGTSKEIRSRPNCSLCRLVFSSRRRTNQYDGPNNVDKFIVALYQGNRFWDEELKSQRNAVFLAFSYRFRYPVRFEDLTSMYCPTFENALHFNANTSQYFMRSISGKEGQHALISSWLSKCDAEHGSSCKGEFSTNNPTLLLVDVRNSCLIQAPSNTGFVALSYAWGLDKGGLFFIT